MTCQGGTLGYADIWYLQHGHSLISEEGVISSEGLRVEPALPHAAQPDGERQDPQPAEALLTYVAECLAKEAGSKAFHKDGTAWDHPRDAWLAHANTAVNAVERWEAETGSLARLCVIPACFRQLHLDRHEPGWMQSSAVGYMCPDHVAALWSGDQQHAPAWGYANPEQPDRSQAVLRCSCGWEVAGTRFRGHGTTLWQVHALEVLDVVALETAGEQL
jgi:hypothetical protein